MKKRILAAFMAAAMVVGMVSGCGSSKSSSKSSGKTSLNLWMPAFADADGKVTDKDFWTEKMKKFEKDNNCNVKVTIVPWDNYEEKYLTGTTSDNGPDVGYMYKEMFYDYIDMGALVNIDKYFTKKEKSNYIYYKQGYNDGGQYGLPVVVGNPRILVANMDILKQAGIDKVPSTWDELTAACKAVKEKVPNVAPFIQDWGNPHYGSLNEIFWPYFWSAGGQIVDKKGNLTINSSAGQKAVDYIYNLKQNGYLPDSCTSNDDTKETMKNGEAAMAIIASSNALDLDGNINWDFQPVLKGPAGAKTFVAADSLVMFDKGENKDLAAKLMKYITSADVMSDFHKKVSEQPPITKDETYTGDKRFENLFSDYADNFETLPVFKGSTSMYDSLFKNMQSMMLGDMKSSEVLKQTTDYYDSNLK